MTVSTPPRVLTVAGSDSGGGAGIQADLKTMLALGVHGMSVIAAVTAQNSVGVQGYWELPPEAVRAQLDSVLGDIGAQAVKTGHAGLAGAGGDRGRGARRRTPRRSWWTRSACPSTATLCSRPRPWRRSGRGCCRSPPSSPPTCGRWSSSPRSRSRTSGTCAAPPRPSCELGPTWALIKGGHLPGEPVDLLTDGVQEHLFRAGRLDNRHTHGTGCTLASAIASYLALGEDVPERWARPRSTSRAPSRKGFPLGAGIGPWTTPGAGADGPRPALTDHAWRSR